LLSYTPTSNDGVSHRPLHLRLRAPIPLLLVRPHFLISFPLSFVLLTSYCLRSYSVTLFNTLYVLSWLYRIFLAPRFCSIRQVPGPEPVHPVWGNVAKILDNEPGVAYREWTDQYGGAVRFRHMLGVRPPFLRPFLRETRLILLNDAQEDRLLLTDPAALNHVLNSHVDTYPKPPVLLADINMLLGGGVSAADGTRLVLFLSSSC
jgi:hypothetical protein